MKKITGEMRRPHVLRHKPQPRYSQMERARAARAMIEASPHRGQTLALFGFLDIFHPEMSGERRRELVRALR